MNPIVTASIISVAGVVIVAVAGFLSTRSAADRTIQAGTDNTVNALNAGRADRLWEKQATTYEETNAYLLYKQEKRRRDIRTGGQNDDEFNARYSRAAWFDIQGRLLT
jgi:hypothetical protein